MPRSARYEGEDVSPTSRRELMGWYAYAVGAEAFAVCGTGSFLPITLEQLARERGVLWSDKTTPCILQSSPSGTGAAERGAALALRLLTRAATQTDNGQCVVSLFGMQINTASFAMYNFSLAVLVQALVLVSFSSFADYGSNRKLLLLIFGFTGATASMLFMIVFPQIYLFGSLLVVISVTCLGSSWVVLNSFLPLLVANDPSIRAASNGRTQRSSDIALETLSPHARNSTSVHHDQQSNSAATGPMLGGIASPLEDFKSIRISPELQLSTQISSKGVGVGYCAAVFVQCLSILLLFILSKTSMSSYSTTLPLRLVLFMVGVWWFTFTMVSRFWLRNRPGPPLTSLKSRHRNKWRSWSDHVAFAWISLWGTIKVAAKLRQAVIFLVAWFLLSDAVATVSATAILFAKTELKMTTTAVAVLSIVATASGMAGAFTWPKISRRLKMKSNHTIIVCIALFEIIPLYGLLGFIPFVKNWGVIGLQQAWEIYPLGFLHGFVAGGLASYCRSLFGLLIPPGSEAAFYALYAITDKGSSIFGPALVGMMVDATGQMRSAFIFLAILILLPIPLIWLVDVDKGRRDGLAMAEAMKVSKVGGEDATISTPERFEEREGLLEDDE